jgi:hypothetical protein
VAEDMMPGCGGIDMCGAFCAAEREDAAEAVPTQVRRSGIYKAKADIVRLIFGQVQVVVCER